MCRGQCHQVEINNKCHQQQQTRKKIVVHQGTNGQGNSYTGNTYLAI